MPLVKDSETSHILVTGTTGSGKSNLFNTLLPQIRQKGQPAVVVDLTGDLIARHYNQERGDIIFNPFDVRSHNWDFWEETSKLSYLNLVARSLYSGRGNNDEMWNNASKKVFIDSVKTLQVRDTKTIKSLYELLAINPLHEMAERLKGTSSSSLLDPKNDKTAMSIRTNTIAFIEWMEYLTESGEKFSMQDWVYNSVKSKSSGWLFLTSTPEQRSMLSPLFRVMIELFVNSLMELGPDYNRRFWLIIDELPAIKKLPSLPLALAEFRKYGGCILSGLQSMNQLTEQYGYYEAATMLGQFNTKFIFRTDEQNIANQISEMFGKVEYQESSENLSYGAHEMRDGVSFGKVERSKQLVTIDDIASLQNLECYVKLPDTHCRVAKIKMEYKALEIISLHSVPLKVKIIKDIISDVNSKDDITACQK
jgi:type IV conjugative transfer system coupling protein TraD